MALLFADIHWTGKVQSVAFTIFGRPVAWYGIIITLAMLVGLVVAMCRGKRVGLSPDEFLEIFICAIPLAIICARLGYVMVRPEIYFRVENFGWKDFVNIFAIWDGGLTIMTGVPGGVLGAYLWSRWRKVDFIRGADLVIPVVILSQALGRWGNFCNQEIYGAAIANPNAQWFPLAVYIADRGGFYQATFFYEMMLNLTFFVAMMLIQQHMKVKGTGILMYLFSYPFVRFIMEFFRDDGNLYVTINYTQIICLMVAILSLAGIVVLCIRERQKGNTVWYKQKIPLSEWQDIHLNKNPNSPSPSTKCG